MSDKDKRDDRPEAYPRPSITDHQLQNQPEFIDEEPNEFRKEISGMPEDKNKEQEIRDKE
jgi:hypothetical protein